MSTLFVLSLKEVLLFSQSRYGSQSHGAAFYCGDLAAGDLVARLVVVPCSQEARGLDAGPRLVQRLMSASDHVSAAIVKQISEEELAHVAVGDCM